MDFNQQVIDEFRANAGRVGGYFEGARLILLTTRGARSGREHTVPLGFLPDGGERIIVIGSAGGGPKHPAWCHNVIANPRVRVEDGVFTYEAEAVVLQGDERDRMFARAVEADQGWADYQAKATRTIPVVTLTQVSGGPPNAASFGAALLLIHGAFRREISLIRKEVAESGAGIGAQLRVNCLTLCQGLRNHHEGEDAGIFPHLASRYPEAEPVIDRLRAEHESIAALVAELNDVIAGGDQPTLLAQVERIADELEKHLAYEEKQLIPLLDH